MSTLFGIFYRDGKPVSNELEFMYSGIQHFPHEKYVFALQGNCGAGHMSKNNIETVTGKMAQWIRKIQISS